MRYIQLIIESCYFLLLIIFSLTLLGCRITSTQHITPKTNLQLNQQVNNFNEKINISYQWKNFIHDPILENLIKNASENNLDLLTVIAKVEEARMNIKVIEGGQLPSLTISSNILRQELANNELKDTFYHSNLNLIWEVDLFGKIRSSIEAAKAEYQANKEDLNDVMISLYSTLFLNYLEIRTKQAQLTYLQENINIQKESLDLISARLQNGLATGLDVSRSKRLLAKAEAEVPILKATISQAINNLSVLIGHKPGYLDKKLTKPYKIVLPSVQEIVKMPKDLLLKRPDVRKAERLLAAQMARRGIAKANLYPNIFLAGSFGFESVHADNLFNSKNRSFSFGPSLTWDLYAGGSIQNEIKVQNARLKQASFSYEKTILNAINEVENMLSLYIENQASLVAIERAVFEAHKSLDLSRELYEQGLIEFQQVLDAQQLQLETQNQLATTKGASAAYFVKLYAALGHSWKF